jgi:hypothetical protein
VKRLFRLARPHAQVNNFAKTKKCLLGIDILEDRTTPAVTATFSAGTLTVTSDNASDTITINAPLLVEVNGNPVPGGVLPSSVTSLFVNGNGGNDTINLTAVTKAQFTALITVFIDGGEGNDIILGSEFDDDIEGGLGNDEVTGRRGNDRINLGLGINLGGVNDGDDTNTWNNGDGSDTIQGGTGEDLQIVNGNTTLGDTFVISRDLTTPRLRFVRNDGGAGLGGFTLDIGTVELLAVNGLGGNDLMTVQDLTGITSLTRIDLDGGDGEDTLVATALPAGVLSAIQFIGGAGNDTISGSQGVDDINAGAGDDNVVGNRGDDLIDLGDGNDTNTWNIGDGTDTVQGGGGTDDLQIVNGGAGNDIFIVSASAPRIVVLNNDNLGTNLASISIGTVESLRIDTFAGNDRITVNDLTGVTGLGLLDFTLGTGSDTVNASALLAGVVPNIFIGGGDRETPSIADGDDTLIGSQGDDTIFGYGGNDTIIGNRGNDLLFGDIGDPVFAGGNDTFVWNDGDGSDTIDGEAGSDTVLVTGGPGNDSFVITPNATDTRIDFRSNTAGNLSIIAQLDLGTIDVIGVATVAGDDRVTATPSSNTAYGLDGGIGTDTFTLVPGGASSPTFQGPGTIVFGNRRPITIENFETVLGVRSVTPLPILVGGLTNGTARVLNPTNNTFEPGATQTFFSNSVVNVRTATADVNGDGVVDFIGATGPGSVTQVVVIDGKTGSTIASWQPFEAAFTGGLFVAAGDIDGDGKADLVLSPDQGGGAVVAVYSGAKLASGIGGESSQVIRFLGIEDPAFRGGARPALGDLDGDGKADLIVSAGFTGGPRIAGFSGRSLFTNPEKLFADFTAFEDTLRNGAFVAVGDLTGDGKAEIVFGGGPGGGPRVRIVDGAKLLAVGSFPDLDRVAGTVQIANFFAGDPNLRGGVRLAIGNVDGDGKADLITGSGDSETSRLRVYRASTLLTSGPNPDQEIDPFGTMLSNGVFVG